MSNIKISACIIAYNHEKYLAEAIEGALKQKVDGEYEIIIGEDCSTDNTRKIVKEYQEKYPNIVKAYFNEKNLGIVGNWVKALKSCTGEYIAICEGDDYWTDPNKLQKQIDFLDKNKDFSISSHNVNIIQDGQITKKFCDSSKPEIMNLEYLLGYGSSGPTCSLVIRNSSIQNLPKWFKDMRGCDWLIQVFSVTGDEKIKYFPNIMGVFRRHGKGSSFSTKENALKKGKSDFALSSKYSLEMIEALSTHFSHKYDNLLRKQSTYWYNIYVEEYLKINNIKKAKKYARKILKELFPLNYWNNSWLTKQRLATLFFIVLSPMIIVKNAKIIKKIIKKFLRKPYYSLIKIKNALKKNYNQKKLEKIFNKYHEYTMIKKSTFIDNLILCQKYSSIPGCVIECGCWRGGMTAGISETINNKQKLYYLFDSFEGLPPAKEIDGKAALDWQSDTNSPFYYDNCKAEIEFAEKAMGLAKNNNYKIVSGWFKDTIPNMEFKEKIAILRLDGDWYDSTMQCLDGLYNHVTEGGIIIIDDYYTWEGCARAVHDFLSKNKLTDRIHKSEKGVCYIIKNK